MSNLEKIRDRALEKGLATENLDEIEKAASACKSTSEAALAEAELKSKISKNHRWEEARQWLTTAATIFGPLLLIATFLLQVRQFSENSRLARDQFAATTQAAHEGIELQWKQFNDTSQRAREDAEDNEFRDILTRAKQTQGPDVVFAMSLLKPFFDRPRHARQAREISVVVLSHIPDPD